MRELIFFLTLYILSLKDFLGEEILQPPSSQCMIFTILLTRLTFLLIHHFVSQKRLPELALKTGILVPKVAHDLPKFKIRPLDHSYNTNLKPFKCITRFAKKCQ